MAKIQRIPLDKLEIMSPKELGDILWDELFQTKPNIKHIKNLIAAGVNVNFKKGTWTPLSWTSRMGHLVAVTLLIEAGASLETQDGISSLHYAVQFGQVKIVEILIEAGASLEAQDRWGYTPLHYATHGHHDNIIKILLKAGASKDVLNNEGKTPWDIATSYIRTHIPELNPNYNG